VLACTIKAFLSGNGKEFPDALLYAKSFDSTIIRLRMIAAQPSSHNTRSHVTISPVPAETIPLRRILRKNPLAAIGIVFVVLFVTCAVFAPWLAPQDPARIELATRLSHPSWNQLFGSDELGRDIFSRVIYGSRISMLVGTCVVAASLSIGLIIGSIAGYYGGPIDRFVNIVLMNAFMSFPGILIAIAFVAFRGPGIFNLIFALSLGGWVGYARLVRAQVLAAREKEYVEAVRALGATDTRILVRHILPNIVQPVIVQAAIGMAGAILAEATMSFLGLGVPPPTASWGAMLNDGRSHLFDAPHLVLFPALAVMLAVLSFNFIGDALRDLLDPRSRIEAGL
jgi:peptide/nickel transport system permease protein